MKKIVPGFAVIITLLISITQCKKSVDPSSLLNNLPGRPNTGNSGNTDSTKPSAVGTPTGPSVSQTIGAAGGTITTADGRMELDIPAGALSANTNITIQNTTNTMASGIGDGYSMMPDGLTFAQPVTFKYHYEDSDIDGSSPYLLDIAYQDSAGYWQAIPVNALDSINQFITVQTNHFTNYATYKLLTLVPTTGDLIQNRKLFVTKRESYVLWGSVDKNVGNLQPLASGQGGAVPNGWLVNGMLHGNSEVGTADAATPQSTGSPGLNADIGNFASCTYIAPGTRPSNNQNPVKLSTIALIPISYLRYILTLGGNTTRKVVEISTRIKILDYNVYRLDIVDYNTLGCGNVINYYDSSDIFFRVGPGDADSYNISQDSIENFPPGASPTTNTCNTCTYNWIAESIGSVNLTSGSVTYSGMSGSYFVILKVTEANENGMWFSETCSGSTGTSTHKPVIGNQTLEIPMQINTSETQLDTLLFGSPNKSLMRLILVKNGMQ